MIYHRQPAVHLARLEAEARVAMEAVRMIVHYDREADALMIEVLPEGTISHAEQTDSIIAHFTTTGQFVLLEILDASEFLSQLVKLTIKAEQKEMVLA